MTTFHRYFAYGLKIDSELELPELTLSDHEVADLSIRFGSLPDAQPTSRSANYSLEGATKWFSWADVGRFRLYDNRELLVERAPRVTDRYLSFAVLGPIIAYILHARGHLVLHASSVGTDGACIGFIADKGVGKSTTAGFCISAGYAPVNDDVMALTFGPQEVFCAPGFPQIKLKHDATAHIELPPSQIMPEPKPGFAKSQHRFVGKFRTNPINLQRIYVLERGPSTAVTPLKGMDAVKRLLANAYIALFARRGAFVSADEQRLLLSQCVRLSELVPIRGLTLPPNLEQMPALVPVLAADWRAPSMPR